MNSICDDASLNINLNVDIITDETNSKIFTSYFKFFLLHYDIIPFRYENFKYYAEGFKKVYSGDDNKSAEEDWNMAMVNKQRGLVIDLSDSIDFLIREIHSEFNSRLVTEVAIFYGTTVLTPREIFLFRLPANLPYHLSENHAVKDGMILRCLTQFINVLGNANVQKMKTSRNTNLFVLYKKRAQRKSAIGCEDEFSFKNEEIMDILDACHNKYVFQMTNQMSEQYTRNCCETLKVYEDLEKCSIMDCLSERETYDVSRAVEWWHQSKFSIQRYECKKIRGKEVWEYL